MWASDSLDPIVCLPQVFVGTLRNGARIAVKRSTLPDSQAALAQDTLQVG